MKDRIILHSKVILCSHENPIHLLKIFKSLQIQLIKAIVRVTSNHLCCNKCQYTSNYLFKDFVTLTSGALLLNADYW